VTVSGSAGCYVFRPTRVPLRMSSHRRSPSQPASCLVVMLPGFGDSAADFDRHGFVRALRRSDIDADVIAVDAHYKYYRKRSVVERLHTDVLAPARRNGYRRIVLVGISMGGLGAVATAREHPNDVDGLVLLAPYLGDAETAQKVRSAGLASFVPDSEPDFFEQNWAYLAGYARGESRPMLALGFGSSDRLAESLRVLAPFVPPERLAIVEGNHGWSTWTPIFESWVADGTIRTACAPANAED